MAKAKALQRRITIPRISESQSFERLLHLLKEKYQCKPVEDKGQYVVGHCRIRLQKEQEIDIVAYTSDVVLIRASPKTASDIFNTVSSFIEKLIIQATTPISTTRPLTMQRTKTLLDYASTLNPAEDVQRMVIFILCDTVNEIILRETMQALRIEGAPLDEGIPDKIKRIEEKGQVVYKAGKIKNIRALRNGIVHRGDIPDQGQATKCLEITRDFLDHS